MELPHNWSRRLLALSFLLLICVILFTSCMMGSNTPTDNGFTDKETDAGNNQTELHVHEFGDWAVTTEPTCTEVGEESRSCACGEVEKKAIEAKGHTYSSVVTDSTCTEKGYTTHTCTCGDTYQDKYVDATGHNFGNWETTKDATCEEKGEQKRECTCEEYETETIPAIGHSYKTVVTEPTCTKQGYTTYTCECGDTYNDNYVKENGHSFGDWYTVNSPSCTTSGTERHDCDNCDYYETQSEAATGHSYTSVVTSPTCTKRGYTTHTCDCGDSYVDTYVKATGHSYESAVTPPTCTQRGYTTHTCSCGDSYVDNYVSTIEHSFGEWETTKEATCVGNGEQKRECDCGKVETMTIEAPGHTYEAVITAPTCEYQGYTSYTCSCGDYYISNYVSRLEHNYSDAVVTAPTCTEKGYTTHICVCGRRYVDTYTEPRHTDETKDNICDNCLNQMPGLYNIYGQMITTWDSLVNVFGMDVTKDYNFLSYINDTSSPYYVLNNNPNLPSGVKLVIGNVKKIGAYAFDQCSNLTSIVIPDSVTSIGEHAFNECSGLAEITIPTNVTLIESNAFDYCSGLTSIVVEEGNSVYHSKDNCLINTAEKTLIRGCKNSIIPSDGSVTSIERAFYGCTLLERINIPDTITTIGYGAFGGCTNLIEVTIPESVTSIGNSAFVNCYSLFDITIPNSVTSIGDHAFLQCTNLQSVTFSDNVTSIGWGAFELCMELENVTIPESLTSISGRTFAYCRKLERVIIPKSVQSIGDYAFVDCPELTYIYYTGTTKEWYSIEDSEYVFMGSPFTVYYYSETKPTEKGNYWHYVEGDPMLWPAYVPL